MIMKILFVGLFLPREKSYHAGGSPRKARKEKQRVGTPKIIHLFGRYVYDRNFSLSSVISVCSVAKCFFQDNRKCVGDIVKSEKYTVK
jgi:hypothetical protein